MGNSLLQCLCWAMVFIPLRPSQFLLAASMRKVFHSLIHSDLFPNYVTHVLIKIKRPPSAICLLNQSAQTELFLELKERGAEEQCFGRSESRYIQTVLKNVQG